MTDTDLADRMTKAEHKIADIESLAFSFGDMLNTRVGRFDAEFTDIRSRFSYLDRAIGMLQTDVRDLRSGVTHQLRGQDDRLRAIEQRLEAVESGQRTIEQRLEAVESGQQVIAGRFAPIESKLDRILQKLDT